VTAAVPLIHAVTVAMVTGIMAEQAGESEVEEDVMERRKRRTGSAEKGNAGERKSIFFK